MRYPNGMRGWRLGVALAAGGVFLAIPAWAQGTPAAGAAESIAATSSSDAMVPDSVVAAALLPDGRGASVVMTFLRGDDLDPRAAAHRGLALLRALKAGIGSGTGDIAAAGEMVQRLASEVLNALRVIELGVDRGFLPPGQSLGFDFGPTGGAVRDGFQGLTPSDARLAGTLRATGGDGDDAMLLDGISGIARLAITLAPGSYRIVPITEPNGASSAESPLGLQILVNDEIFPVLPMRPDQWVQTAYLSQQGEDFATSGIRPGSRAATRGGATLSTMRGGITVIEAATRPGAGGLGEIVLEFRSAAGALPYLAGLFIESSDGPSSLWLSPRARATLLSADERLALEGELLAALADLLSGIATAAGPAAPPPPFLTIPEFVAPPAVVVSAS
ncbi:MAG: hypothetical protein U1E97_11695 [Alphaproteobacteria bacterium]